MVAGHYSCYASLIALSSHNMWYVIYIFDWKCGKGLCANKTGLSPKAFPPFSELPLQNGEIKDYSPLIQQIDKYTDREIYGQ